MERAPSLATVSDDDLLRRLSDLLAQCRRDEASLVAHIAEADSRRLFAREASSFVPNVPNTVEPLPESRALRAPDPASRQPGARLS